MNDVIEPDEVGMVGGIKLDPEKLEAWYKEVTSKHYWREYPDQDNWAGDPEQANA